MKKFASYAPAIVVLLCVIVSLFAVPQIIERYAYAQQNAKITLARGVLAQDDILRRIDRATSAIADSIEPSVVHIETRREQSELLPTQSSLSTGAGWVYDTSGHIVTNAHVVQSTEDVSIEFSTGKVVSGKVIGIDPYTDIAVIQAEQGNTYFSARRANARLPRTGERVYAFGSPFGFKFSMSEGIVSGLGREAGGSNVTGGYTNYIQTDAAVNPGNSGGPLVNSDGHIIGMNVAIATSRSVGQSPEESQSDSAGISFAIPLGTIEPIVNQIIQYGKVSRGYLGIRYDSDPTDRINFTLNDGSNMSGILVTSVEVDGPSYDAGIEMNDVIVSIQGSPALNAESLSSLISSGRPGDTITVEIYRDQRLINLPVTLGEMKAEVLARRILEPIMVQLGMSIQPWDTGVLVRTVWPGFPGENAGFAQGDVITAINGKSFDDYFSFFVLLADEGILTGSRVTFSIIRMDQTQDTITLRLER